MEETKVDESLLNIFKTVLKDLKNDDIIVNIKGLNDLIQLKEHFSEYLVYYEKIIECIGYILQKLCVRPDNIDDLEIEYNLHKKALSLIENIVVSAKELLSIAASEIFMERLVDIIEYFSLIIGNIGNYVISMKKIQKFTIIHDCLYSILSIFTSLFSSPKLFKLLFATLNKSSSFQRLITVIGETLVKDYGYVTQEKMLELCCRFVTYAKDKNIITNPTNNIPKDLQKQFENFNVKHIFENRRTILQEINKKSNPQMDSVEIVKFYVEIVNKKSKKRTTKEYLTRSIASETWFDLTAIEIVIEMSADDELISLPLSKVDSPNINRTKTQLHFVCSQRDDALWSYLTEEEKTLSTAEVIFGIEVSIENSTMLNSMYIKLEKAIERLNQQQESGNSSRSIEKVSIVSMTDVETPCNYLQTKHESIPLLASDEEEIPVISPTKTKEKRQHIPRKDLNKDQHENIEKKAENKDSTVGSRRSPRTSPEQNINKISQKRQPLPVKSKKAMSKPADTTKKQDIFDFDEEDNKDEMVDKPQKRKQDMIKGKAVIKGKEKESKKKQSETEKDEKVPVRKAPMRAASITNQEQNLILHESIQSRAKIRISESESSKRKDSSNSSTDSYERAAEFTREESMDIEYEEEAKEEVVEDRFVQSHYKLRKENRQEEFEDSFSYEFTSQTLNDIGENDDEQDDPDQNVEVMGTITDVSDDDISEDKDDIIMPLVKELMVIQEKRVAKKRTKRMEELLTTATQQVIGYCDSWKKSSISKSPTVTIDTKSTKEKVKEFFSKIDRDFERLNQEQNEIQDIAKNIVKEEKELKNDVKQFNTFIKNEIDALKTELKKRKTMLVEDISKKIVPPSKVHKTTANDFMEKFKSKYA